jgi:hypothetical protein
VVAALAEEKQAKFKRARGGQNVVYCDTVRKAEQYTKRLGGLYYHRNIGGAEATRAVVRRLRKGTGPRDKVGNIGVYQDEGVCAGGVGPRDG